MPLPRRGTTPNFCLMSVVAKRLDGTEVSLGPGDIALDGDQAPLKKAQPPLFGPCLLWTNGWMDQDATWYEGRPQPRPHCVRWGSSSP